MSHYIPAPKLPLGNTTIKLEVAGMFGRVENTLEQKFHHGVLHINAICTFFYVLQRFGVVTSR